MFIYKNSIYRQNALTHISEIADVSNFSDTAYNSAYVCDVQSLIAKCTLKQFSTKIVLTR